MLVRPARGTTRTEKTIPALAAVSGMATCRL
jgi:hypothetical protein